MTTPMDGVETTVDAFNVGPLTVERRSAPTKDDYGVYQPGPATTYVVNPVAAHPVTGRDLDVLPEADRNSGVYQFYARRNSFPANITNGWRVSDKGYDADIVQYNGRRYRLTAAPDYNLQGRVWCALGVLMETQQ